jgi:hypothetical protein
MKHSFIILLILIIALNLTSFGQTKISKDNYSTVGVKSTGRVHKGFYGRFGIGPIFGSTKFEDSGSLNIKGEFKGTGAVIELVLGAAIQRNLVIDFDLTSRAVTNPDVSVNSSAFQKTDNLSIGEVTYSAGATYFILPIDIYAGVSIGTGAFVISDTKSNQSSRSDYGFSFTLKAGKMFWLGKHFGMGAGLGFGHTNTSTIDNGVTEIINSNRFFITGGMSIN